MEEAAHSSFANIYSKCHSYIRSSSSKISMPKSYTDAPSLFPVSFLWTELINTQVFLLAKEVWYGQKWGQGKPAPSPYE
jgi:hypothetical protein